MIDQRYPFLKPYALVLDQERQVREVISYPYDDAETLVNIREVGDSQTMVQARAASLTTMKPHEFQKRSDGFLYCQCGASENDSIHRSMAHWTDKD